MTRFFSPDLPIFRLLFLVAVQVACWKGLVAQPPFQKHFGGNGDDFAYTICKTSDAYFIAGSTNSAGEGGQDILVIKMDFNGDVLLAKTIGGSGQDVAMAMVATPDNGCALTGTTSSSGNGGDDLFIMKLDANANVQWVKTMGGGNDEKGTSIGVAPDGGLMICGFGTSYGAQRDWMIIKTDMSGNVQFSKVMGGPDNEVAFDVIPTPDGGYFGIGTSAGFGTGLNESMITKHDAAGNLQVGSPGTELEFAL